MVRDYEPQRRVEGREETSRCEATQEGTFGLFCHIFTWIV
jgi:hypothetical protein